MDSILYYSRRNDEGVLALPKGEYTIYGVRNERGKLFFMFSGAMFWMTF